MTPFPELPIVTPDPPRKTQSEKYGGLLYLGGAGLVVLTLLIGWFGYGVWSLRSVWRDIYVLNDPRQLESVRIAAAYRLAKDPNVTQRQRWDLALSRIPPATARYLVAESLDSELVDDNPRAYALAVARSQGWPSWLRVLLARPLAVAAGEGTRLDESSIQELAKIDDGMIKLLCDYALAVDPGISPEVQSQAVASLQEAKTTPYRRFAQALLNAKDSRQPDRSDHLQEATSLIRARYTEASGIEEDVSANAMHP